MTGGVGARAPLLTLISAQSKSAADCPSPLPSLVTTALAGCRSPCCSVSGLCPTAVSSVLGCAGGGGKRVHSPAIPALDVRSRTEALLQPSELVEVAAQRFFAHAVGSGRLGPASLCLRLGSLGEATTKG